MDPGRGQCGRSAEEAEREQRRREQPAVRPPGGDDDRGKRRHGQGGDDVVTDARRPGGDGEHRSRDAAERRRLEPDSGLDLTALPQLTPQVVKRTGALTYGTSSKL